MGSAFTCQTLISRGSCSDVHSNTIMMDPAPLFSELPHPVRQHKSYDFKRRVTQRTRTSHPTKYYYIDFGLSLLCHPPDASPLIRVSIGGDKTVPEYEDPDVLRDPYKIDVYCLGNLLRDQFLGVSEVPVTRASSTDVSYGCHRWTVTLAF